MSMRSFGFYGFFIYSFSMVSQTAYGQDSCRFGLDFPGTPSSCSSGDCDGAGFRDQYEHYSIDNKMRIRIKFIIFGDGVNYIVDNQELDPQMQILNEDFENYGIEFVDSRKYVHDAAYRDLCGNCDLPADYNDGCCYQWTSMCRGDCDGAVSCPATEESMMKDEHKDDPDEQLNIYVVNNEYMNLAGIAYFPWCEDATEAPG